MQSSYQFLCFFSDFGRQILRELYLYTRKVPALGTLRPSQDFLRDCSSVKYNEKLGLIF
jgi:hypothetical protein